MSHIICPLCGKNSPMSTFDPASLDLDLRACSFKGAGRYFGFRKVDEHSVLGDDVYSIPVSRRVLSLTKMFLDHNILDVGEIMNTLGIDKDIDVTVNLFNDEKTALLIQNNELKKKCEKVEKQLSENRMKMMQKLNDEEVNETINYALRGGLGLDNKRIIDMDDDGWWINVDSETPGYILYLQHIYPHLTEELRTKIRERVKTNDKNTRINLNIIWGIKRIPTIAEQLSGNSIPYNTHTSLDEIKSIVATVKNKIDNELKERK
jgi:hypothetical protein